MTQINWKSVDGLKYSRQLFNRMVYTCFGLYLWEYLLSLDFEYKVITKKVKTRWPLAIYFANRYLLLFCLIISVTLNNVPSNRPDQCRPLMLFVQITGHLTLGMASANLAIRAIAIWEFNPYITGLVVLVALGQWVLIIIGAVQLEVTWTAVAGCQPHQTSWMLKTLFVWSIFFDLLVLSLSVFKLRASILETRGFKSFGLTSVILKHGVLFFAIATLGNLVAAVFLFMNLNSLMSAFFNIPAEVISTIAACRAVRYLMTFSQNDSVVVSTAQATSRPIVYGLGRKPVFPSSEDTSPIDEIDHKEFPDLSGPESDHRLPIRKTNIAQ